MFSRLLAGLITPTWRQGPDFFTENGNKKNLLLNKCYSFGINIEVVEVLSHHTTEGI